MTILYNIAIYLYHLSIFIASFFNEKARKWIEGRKNIFKQIEKESFSWRNSTDYLVWFHCASLGEFEQARPLIERLKNKSGNIGDIKILISFFSPSGYEIRKNYPLADHVFYLPMDSASNAKKFINSFNPSLAIFVKYEFWFHYLQELNKKNIPVFLISASFRTEHLFFKWYGGWFRNMLKKFTYIFVQNEISKKLLENINIESTLSGDTRFDRVFETAKESEAIPLIEQFRRDKKVFIAGSTWPEDEEIMPGIPYKKYTLKIIIAPHEIREARINSILHLFSAFKTLRFSQANEKNIEDAEVLVIDNIGMLSRLYRYGNIAYIGGGFGKSLHNILEAAAFGIPVLFGPNHQNFWEAKALMDAGGAFIVKNTAELNNKLSFLLHDEMILKIASEMSRNFVRSNTGATERILAEVLKLKNN